MVSYNTPVNGVVCSYTFVLNFHTVYIANYVLKPDMHGYNIVYLLK